MRPAKGGLSAAVAVGCAVAVGLARDDGRGVDVDACDGATMGPIAWTAGDGDGAGAGATGTGVPSIEGCDDGAKVAVTRVIRVGGCLECLILPTRTATTSTVAMSASVP